METIILKPTQGVYEKAEVEQLFTALDAARDAAAEKDKLIDSATAVFAALKIAVPGLVEGKVDITTLLMGGGIQKLMGDGGVIASLKTLGEELEAYQAKQAKKADGTTLALKA